MKKKLVLIAILLLVAAFAFGCTSVELQFADPAVKSIVVSGVEKVDYYAGDTVDVQGAKVIATYDNDEIKEYDLELDMLSDYDMNIVEDNKSITVTFGGKKTTFCVNVKTLVLKEITLSSLPLKREYVEGEKVSAKGARLSILYEGGKTVYSDVTDKMLEEYDNTRLGEQNIFISYYNYRLYFPVVFIKKTVTEIEVRREPYQASVFVGYGDNLSLDGMRLRMLYDNELDPIVNATDILDELRVYVDDSSVSSKEVARVAYLANDYPETFVYTYSGEPIVKVGDYVTPTTELAGNGALDNVVSKSYGVVQSIGRGTMTISTVVSYACTELSVEEGEILLFNEAIGRRAGNNVYAAGGGGIVTKIEEGIVYMQTTPVASFPMIVQDRSYQSMEIITYPTTSKFNSPITDVIQGDTIDLSSGVVTVTYDNGEKETYKMDHSLIKVVNSDDDLLRSEIDNFEFISVDDVKDLPTGRYELLYGVKHTYPEDKIELVVSVIDEEGNNKYVQENRYVSLDEKMNYTVSITAKLNDGGTEKVSECVYHLATVGAGVRRSQLDITAAGWHKINVVYRGAVASGVEKNYVVMDVKVIQRYPERLNIVPVSDNISGRSFLLGQTIPLTTLRYTITYNNGDQSEEIGVTKDMLREGYTLLCDELTDEVNKKKIEFVIPNAINAKTGEPVSSGVMECDVIPVPIKSVSLLTQPTDPFLTAPATSSNDVDLTGATLRIYYEDNSVSIVGRDVDNELKVLLQKTEGERISLVYPDAVDQDPLDIEKIIEMDEDAQYTARLTYYDKYGASGECSFPFYIVERGVRSVKVSYRADYYKDTYIQCENWDLTGITINVTWQDNTSETRPATMDMIFESTTDEIGTNLPLKFRFLGKTDVSTLKYNVKPRHETALAVKRTGKDTYYNTDYDLDLSQYRFALSYNAGASAEVLGVTAEEMTGSRTTVGWWYELYDTSGNKTQFRRIGTKRVRLYHTSIFDNEGVTVYNIVYVDFTITVNENMSTIESVSYDDNSIGTREGLNVLAETAAGWDLFLSEYDPVSGEIKDKYLTVHYTNGTTGYVDIVPEMLTYDKRDATLGYTKVRIAYKGYTTTVLVHVRNATLNSVVVEKEPITNFIAHSNINLDGGILKIVFKINEATEGEFYKYLYFEDKQITTTGFNSDINPDIDHITQEITVRFRDKTATYRVTIYNKQPITFLYQNTIFFYGNTKAAVVTPLQLIPEFDLPDRSEILMWYAENSAFIAEEDFAAYLAAHPELDEEDFLKVITADGSSYVPRSALYEDYFIEPANPGYDYYIVMEINGNYYYRAESYAIQKFTIIPKVIEVTAVDYNDKAYVKSYDNANARENAMAIYYLYRELSTYINGLVGGKIVSVELLSPNAKGFEIAVFVTADFDLNVEEDATALNAIFDRINNALTREKNLRSINVSGEVRRGVNVGYYNGMTPERVSYRVAAGETLTRRNAAGEDILELLSGALSLVDTYTYGVGDTNIAIGTLGNKNYNIDFQKGKKFKVLARPIEEFTVSPSTTQGLWQVATVSDFDEINVMVTYLDGGYRYISASEITYYTDSGLTQAVDGVPTEAGTYYARVATPGAFVDADENEIDITFKVIKE